MSKGKELPTQWNMELRLLDWSEDLAWFGQHVALKDFVYDFQKQFNAIISHISSPSIHAEQLWSSGQKSSLPKVHLPLFLVKSGWDGLSEKDLHDNISMWFLRDLMDRLKFKRIVMATMDSQVRFRSETAQCMDNLHSIQSQRFVISEFSIYAGHVNLSSPSSFVLFADNIDEQTVSWFKLTQDNNCFDYHIINRETVFEDIQEINNYYYNHIEGF